MKWIIGIVLVMGIMYYFHRRTLRELKKKPPYTPVNSPSEHD